MTGLRALALASLIAAVSACTVGPDYAEPTIELADSFAEGEVRPIGDVAAERWWLGFEDQILNDLVERGLTQNLDIRTTLARVAEAEAALRARGLPSLVSGSVTASADVSGGDNLSTSGDEALSANPSIVIDLFGGERRAGEQALAQLQSAELDVGTARLAYVSSLVGSYIELRYNQAALAYTRQTIAIRRETLDLVRTQRQAGTATELDELQAQANLEDARASLPAFETAFYAAAYAIATLIAEPVQAIEEALERGAPQPAPPRDAAETGTPADLLRNRPDIRAAERDFAAAVAAVGVSVANMYPSLSLSGAITISGSSTWSFGPSLSIPVLNQPLLQANRDQAIAQAEAAELAWRSSVLAAVEDVQSAQSDYLRNGRAVSISRRAVASYTRVVELSRQTYEAGATTLLNLLDNQRSLLSANLTLALAYRDYASSWASLKVAAGQGWRLPGS